LAREIALVRRWPSRFDGKIGGDKGLPLYCAVTLASKRRKMRRTDKDVVMKRFALTPLKSEAQSKDYLSKPAAKGE
jgi:hypothetical protein